MGGLAVIAYVVLPGVTRGSSGVGPRRGWLDEHSSRQNFPRDMVGRGARRNVGAWESEQAINNFGTERLGFGMAKAGI